MYILVVLSLFKNKCKIKNIREPSKIRTLNPILKISYTSNMYLLLFWFMLLVEVEHFCMCGV